MNTINESIDVNVPVSTAYNQWTQFEDFPKIMDDVQEVKQLDDTHVHWRAEVMGKDVEWDSEITEQVPDRIIAWRSVGGPEHAGAVEFEPVGSDKTRIRLRIDYEAKGMLEKAGDLMGTVTRRTRDELEHFKEFIERRGHETGAWRGAVGHGSTGGMGEDFEP
jgi:uncharacterized membrane protein